MCPGVIRLSDIFARLIDPFPLPDAQQFYIKMMQVTIALSAYDCNILFLYNSLSTAKHIQLRPMCVKVNSFLLHKSGIYRVLKQWQEASTVCSILKQLSGDSQRDSLTRMWSQMIATTCIYFIFPMKETAQN